MLAGCAILDPKTPPTDRLAIASPTGRALSAQGFRLASRPSETQCGSCPRLYSRPGPKAPNLRSQADQAPIRPLAVTATCSRLDRRTTSIEHLQSRSNARCTALAQGAASNSCATTTNRIVGADCITGEGWRLSDCTLGSSRPSSGGASSPAADGGPYRITRLGAASLRSQLDNRVTARAW